MHIFIRSGHEFSHFAGGVITFDGVVTVAGDIVIIAGDFNTVGGCVVTNVVIISSAVVVGEGVDIMAIVASIVDSVAISSCQNGEFNYT